MQTLAYFGSPSHWFILAIVCLIVFGSRRLPEIARNLGKSLGALKKARREFEEELMHAQEEDDKKPVAELEAQKSRPQESSETDD